MAAGTLTGGFTLSNAFYFNSVISSSEHAQELRAATHRIANDVLGTMTWPADLACSKAQYEIRAALQLQPGWDSYTAVVPSSQAGALAMRAIELVRRDFFAAPHIVAAAEGGIAAAFSVDDKFGQVEILNSGTVLTTTFSANQSPRITKFSSDERSLNSAIEAIRDFLSR